MLLATQLGIKRDVVKHQIIPAAPNSPEISMKHGPFEGLQTTPRPTLLTHQKAVHTACIVRKDFPPSLQRRSHLLNSCAIHKNMNSRFRHCITEWTVDILQGATPFRKIHFSCHPSHPYLPHKNSSFQRDNFVPNCSRAPRLKTHIIEGWPERGNRLPAVCFQFPLPTVFANTKIYVVANLTDGL